MSDYNGGSPTGENLKKFMGKVKKAEGRLAKSKALEGKKKLKHAYKDKGDKRPGAEGSGKFGSRNGEEYLEQ